MENLMKSWILALSLIVSCVTLADAAPRSHQLSMVDLGTLGGRFGSANALNNRNQVVGESQTTTFASHAFLWKDGTMADLKTLPGHNTSEAYDINDRGQIIGFSSGPGEGRAVLWKRGAIVDLGLPPDAGACAAQAILQ
jgi:probable HAF family extracellular repeat protein